MRTITLGISLLDCITDDLDKAESEIFTTRSRQLAEGSGINRRGILRVNIGIPIVNKRISVTPIALVGEPVPAKCPEDLCDDRQRHWISAAKKVGVNFLGGYSALVIKGNDTRVDEYLIRSIPQALATDRFCLQFR